MENAKARFLIKFVPFANIVDLLLQANGEEPKKTDGENEEVSGVPEQVAWSFDDNCWSFADNS